MEVPRKVRANSRMSDLRAALRPEPVWRANAPSWLANLLLAGGAQVKWSEETTPETFRLPEPYSLREGRLRGWAQQQVSTCRASSRRSRRAAMMLQFLTILGAISTTALIGVGGKYHAAYFSAMVASSISGVAAGFNGYFQFTARSFNLAATADAIEREVRSYGASTDKYAEVSSEVADSMLLYEILRLERESRDSAFW